MSKAISAREAQSLRIREALLNACGDLLSEQPIDAITINNIVETAGVAKGSFYNHFPDKEALAAEVSSAIRVELERSVEESNRNVTDPAYRLVRGMCIHLQMAVADPRRAIIMLRGAGWRTATNNPLNEGIKADIADGLASGRFEPRCEDAGVIQVIGAVFFTMLRIIEEQHSAEQAIELATRVFTLILCGFGLREDEAVRIVADSARDLITG
ncbi:MAG: TetR family transcriptional regulator [Haliea sp.]|jgi:AcrR family transcriptional regulator|nr:TetR family transcriptional regulator [Haliea sp.]